ncbi:MAG: hypothetical protein COS72_03340, partial [Candidatus Moranbacteria bacterium CG06_land_8_20_14_3_00_43_56]
MPTDSLLGVGYDPATLSAGTVAAFSGNVGIGTTSPYSKLHINGGTGTLSTGLTFGDGDSGLYEVADDKLIFQTLGSDK